MAHLKRGSTAPDFVLPNQDGELRSLADFAGRSLVVFFYSRDAAPGCSTEVGEFNDLLSGFSCFKTDVVGISPDDPAVHQEFYSRFSLGMDLLSDRDHTVMDAYGVWKVKVRWTGQMTVSVIRSSFLIGPNGKIAAVWYDVEPLGHAQAVHAALSEKAVSDRRRR